MAYRAELDDRTYTIDVKDPGDVCTIEIDGVARVVDARRIGARTYSLLIDGRSFVADVGRDGEQYTVSIGGMVYRLRLVDERRYHAIVLGEPKEEKGRREVRAQIPGRVVDIFVEVGERVARGQSLLTIEAMKMENEIKSPASGEVQEILAQPGRAIEAGALLIVIQA